MLIGKNPMPPSLLAILSVCSILCCCTRSGDSPGPPFAPEEALGAFRLPEGFEMELVAAEPLIADPVAMEIDEEGNFWVVEMHGYPDDVEGSGVVKKLTDTDGDGRPDHSQVFYDGLVLPTGIMRWRQGVLVTDAPDLLYLEDSDGDGRADRREVVLSGFSRSNPQHNFNTPRFELDNWIYLGHEGAIGTKRFTDKFGDEGSEIHFPDRPGAPRLPRNANGRSVRFDPLNSRLEMLSGETQFGYSFDPWGHLFNSSNYYYLFHEVVAARYLARNPDLLIDDPTFNMPAEGPGTQVFPITDRPEHQLLTDVGVITSGCGTTWYTGGRFPEPFDRVVFTAEPVHNLVHTDIIEDFGASFLAKRQYADREFLASTDSWFRPVNFYVGPDGALYLVDYYRQIIEHPEWMSEEVNQSGALYNGSDRGRIYRISYKGMPAMNFSGKLSLATADTDVLVDSLAAANGWWRRHAQRRIFSEQRREAIPRLRELAGQSSRPEGRIHALWTLEGLGGTTEPLLVDLLKHPHPGVRENAIRAAEAHLQEWPSLAQTLLAMSADSSAKVRFQLLCTLGFLEGPEVETAQLQLLERDADDVWVSVAAVSGARGREQEWFSRLSRTLGRQETEPRRLLFEGLAQIIARRGEAATLEKLLLESISGKDPASAWWRAAALKGLSTAADSLLRPVVEKQEPALAALFHPKTPAALRQAGLELWRRAGFSSGKYRELEAIALNAASDSRQEVFYRVDAVRLLGWNKQGKHEAALEALLRPETPSSIQVAAIEALGTQTGDGPCRRLLNFWPALTPELRDAAVEVFMHDADRQILLLEAVEEGRIQASALGWGRTVALLNEWNEKVRAKARKVLEGNETGREQVLAEYQPVLKMAANAERGKEVFKRACSICHQMNGSEGIAVGPDLAAVRNRTKAAILNDILQPNQSIADGYELWNLSLRDGRRLSGIVAKESPAALTLRDLSGKETTIARSELVSLEAQANSAMPNGLEQAVDEQEMADLLEYLKKGK